MSILIKGMSMPTSCDDCDFVQHGTADWCYVTEKDIPCDCPLVEVPPHGRLIDVDALTPYLLNEHYKYRLVYDADEVKNAPTIIEAEEEKNMNLYDKVCNQKIRSGCESICWTCIHLKVCFAKDNQPCIECDQYKQTEEGK